MGLKIEDDRCVETRPPLGNPADISGPSCVSRLVRGTSARFSRCRRDESEFAIAGSDVAIVPQA